MPQGQSNVAHQLIELFNAGNLEGVRALVDPDIVYEETGTGRRIQGFDDYHELMRVWRQALPDVAGKVTSSIESGDRVALEINWTGTQSGPLITPTGEIPASGKPIDIQSSLWCTLRNGKITEVHHYLDVLMILQQIGALG